MTPRTISLGLVQNLSSSTPYVPPTKKDWDILFQPMFDEYFHPSSNVVSYVLPDVAPIPADTIELSSEESSSRDVITTNLHPANAPFEHLSKWTKDHPLDNMIGNPSRSVSIRRKLQTDALWCYFDAFLTLVEPKNYKEALKETSWIEAMQEEIHEFKRLQV
ncbi:hypothetical protein Tco_1048567 [Tanacetum coccineum]